jgi:hypothetical protein
LRVSAGRLTPSLAVELAVEAQLLVHTLLQATDGPPTVEKLLAGKRERFGFDFLDVHGAFVPGSRAAIYIHIATPQPDNQVSRSRSSGSHPAIPQRPFRATDPKGIYVQVDLDQQKLLAHGLSAQDVSHALAQQNIVLPAGDQKIGALDFLVQTNASPVNVDTFNTLLGVFLL